MPFVQVVIRHGVCQAEEWHPMVNRQKFSAWRCSYLLSRAVDAGKLWIFGLECFKLVKKAIEFCIAYFRLTVNVIEKTMMLNLADEIIHTRLNRGGFGEIGYLVDLGHFGASISVSPGLHEKE